MLWPQSQEYNEAIQNPKTCFNVPDLRQGHAATNTLGMPVPCSGNFADVYRVHTPGSTTGWAIKCFTRGDPSSLRLRYAQIDKHLQQAKLRFTIGFQFLDEGIRIRDQWHPVLRMKWVEGLTLNHFVRESLATPEVLDSLLKRWTSVAGHLRKADMAHADLQHGNILLVPGTTANTLSVKLIDYDGMWVPSLAGQQSGEVGHPAYQHPQRIREGIYSREVDRFPLLVIATALRCLRVAGRSLWERYDNGDNLLFRERDFEAPDTSPLFKELSGLQDPQARHYVECLRTACRRPLDQTPHLEELSEEAGATKKAAIPTWAANEPTPPASRAVAAVQAVFDGLSEKERTPDRDRKQPIATTAKKAMPADPGAIQPAVAVTGVPSRPLVSHDRHPASAGEATRSGGPSAARPWLKWGVIGGSVVGALLTTIVVIALSGGNGKDTQKSKTTDGQAANTDKPKTTDGQAANTDKPKNTDGQPANTDKPKNTDGQTGNADKPKTDKPPDDPPKVEPMMTVADWIQELSDPNEKKRAKAALALRDAGADAKKAVPALKGLIASEKDSPETRLNAAQTLSKISQAEAESVAPVVAGLSGALTDTALQREALELLTHVVGPSIANESPERRNRVLQELRKALRIDGPTKEKAAGALSSLREHGLPALQDLAEIVADQAVPVKARINATITVGRLFFRLREMPPAESRGYYDKLKDAVKADTVEKIAKGLEDKAHGEVRYRVAEALAYLNWAPFPKDVARTLVGLIRDDPEPRVRQYVICAFMVRQDSKDVPGLFDAVALRLKDPNKFVSYDAARMLAGIKKAESGDDVVDILEKMLNDQDLRVNQGPGAAVQFADDGRFMAADALSLIGPPAKRESIVKTLKEMTESKDARIKQSAERALKAMEAGSTPVAEEVKPAVLTLDEKGQATHVGELSTRDPLYKGRKRHKLFLVQFEAGKSYQIDLKSSAFDSYLFLEDPAEVVVSENNDGGGLLDARILVKATKTGQHRIIATQFDDKFGKFTLTVQQTDARTPNLAKVEPLRFDKGKATVAASLEKNDATLPDGKQYKEYSFAAAAGQSSTIELDTNGFTGCLVLKSETRKILEKSVGSGIVYKAQVAGTYHIVVTSQGNETTGKFALTVSQTATVPQKIITKPSGLRYVELDVGAGKEVKVGDTVTVHSRPDPIGCVRVLNAGAVQSSRSWSIGPERH